MDDLLEQIRRALADYMASEGCSCCENTEAHHEARMRLGELLGIPQYTDGSGIDYEPWRGK